MKRIKIFYKMLPRGETYSRFIMIDLPQNAIILSKAMGDTHWIED
jgi:hypothetical protein